MLEKKYLKSKAICKVTFSLPADAAGDAKEIKVLGEFNNWSWEEGAPMKLSKGQYKATLELETGRSYQFRYLADNSVWLNDHQADQYVASPYHDAENAVVFIEEMPASEPKPKTSKPKAKKKTTATAKSNDLKKIEGIGPKIEKLLKDKGITTFQELSKAKVDTLKEILQEAGSRYRMHDPTTWIEQANLAAKEEWDALKEWQAQLKGGRK